MNEEKRRGLFTTTIVCLFIILCFGFLRNPGEVTPPEKDNPENYRPKAVASTAHASPATYTIRLEDEKLNLYLNSDGETIFMEYFEIDESLYPSADISELKEGITLTGIERCVGIIEDFTS